MHNRFRKIYQEDRYWAGPYDSIRHIDTEQIYQHSRYRSITISYARYFVPAFEKNDGLVKWGRIRVKSMTLTFDLGSSRVDGRRHLPR